MNTLIFLFFHFFFFFHETSVFFQVQAGVFSFFGRFESENIFVLFLNYSDLVGVKVISEQLQAIKPDTIHKTLFALCCFLFLLVLKKIYHETIFAV